MKFCQSCGMPLSGDPQLLGTNADGSKNEDYCEYCYVDGKYTVDTTMDRMIEFCIPHVLAANPQMTEDSARAMMKEMYPTLKRWQGK